MAKAAVHEVVVKRVVLEVTEQQAQVIALLLTNTHTNDARTDEVYAALSEAGMVNWGLSLRDGYAADRYIDGLTVVGL